MQFLSVDPLPFLEDSSGYKGAADQVFVPPDTEAVHEIVREASKCGIPLTIAGAGTGLTGARVPKSGWVVSLERFRTLEIVSGKARCGVGVSLADLHREAARTKQFFGPNPTETSASIGGIIATNAGGARSFRFGAVRHHVLSLTAVFMDGRVATFHKGDRVDFPYQPVQQPATTKNAAGYWLKPDLEWVQLLSGSEGTLAIITEAELQLLPDPPALLSGVIFFGTEDAALDAVDVWRPIDDLRLLEMLDERSLNYLRPRYGDLPTGAKAALMIEQDLLSETDSEVDTWLDRLSRQGAYENESWFGLTVAERERFRKFRHDLPIMMVDHGRRSGAKFGTDFAVPLNRGRELYRFYVERCEALFPGHYAIFGHAGDANVHVNLLARGPEDAQTAEALMTEFAKFVLSLGGTVAAEHGIGKHKTNLLQLMYSRTDIEAMKQVKRQLDPGWLLGQGTIFDLQVSGDTLR
jgi:FAD/FMN-containing dehydrogenase